MENNIFDIDRETEAFEYANAQPLQRTEEWFTQRLGRFTASRISELLGIKGLGLTGEGYAFEKACEIVFGKDDEEDFESYDMKRGNMLEPLAFGMFKRKMDLDFVDVTETHFFEYGTNAGASPDGLVGKDEILEIKCPRSKKFFKVVQSNEVDKKYYDQMQMQMLCTESVACNYFNYIQFNGKEYGHLIRVERDEERINLITERIEEATVLRDKYIIDLKSNTQGI